MNTLKNIGIATAIATAGFVGGQMTVSDVSEPTIVYQEDAGRVIDILTSLEIASTSLQSLLPMENVDEPVDKDVSASSSLETYFINGILDGNQPRLGGTLNSLEIQALYANIANDKGLITEENINNGVNIYDEIRK